MRKKVLFRIRSMEIGEAQKTLLNLLDFLDRARYEPMVLLDFNEGELLNDIPGDIPVFFIAKGKAQLTSHSILRLFQRMERHRLLAAYRCFPELLWSKIGDVPDIEIAMMHSSLKGLMESPFKNSTKINWFDSDINFFSKYYRKKMGRMMNLCNATVFVAQSTQYNFENYLGISVSNSICIYSTFNVKEVRKKSLITLHFEDRWLFKGEKIFVSVGRLVFQKGYDLLIEIHAELIKEGINHKIMVIGDGPVYEALMKKIKLLKVEDTFLLLGNRENPYPYITKADYYIQSSRYEGYHLSIREAMILGKPLISTNVGGVKEIVSHNKTGLLTHFSRYDLKKAIKKFLTDENYVSHISENQKEINFDHYNQRVLEQLEDILH
ncbi:glycosyltransferase [Chryseobacterium fistulae]|uniref:N-acetyl-alpha-D-glucosaminyl L-malate synthase n=1 Tax=Chryseobacterium fistulae TaxID=2675058 RepID=A0A6N4XRW2_9FLAO|nr:glycosyltransferase [Chryseobacterium fistulae]CAA7391363.1 N-acetyl-alpha-D-glucosaminyl L-malate synthase [Chryseobacterium fistulae]